VLRYNGTTGACIDVFTRNGPPIDSAFAGRVFGPDGHSYANRFHEDRVERYDGTTGAFLDTFVAPGSGGLNTPDTLTFGPAGHLYVASQDSGAVLRLTARQAPSSMSSRPSQGFFLQGSCLLQTQAVKEEPRAVRL
jgi:hypothetical protein